MFTSFELNPIVLENVKRAGYSEPTPIQQKAIPLAMAGSNLIVTAETGSGKTAAFALPMISALADRTQRGKMGLILCPTREVAQQTHKQIVRFSVNTIVTSVAIYGGVSMEPQFKALRAGPSIIVATPGRLLDHLNRGTVKLSTVAYLILDEADRMLDMGFIPDVSRIISMVPQERQSMLFSATMPSEIIRLSDRFVKNPVRVSDDTHGVPPETLTQGVCPAESEDKVRLLVAMLREEAPKRTLVFARTKSRAERVAKQLSREGIKATFIHGGRSQRQRDDALEGFRRGAFAVLVGTDVAGRGIDVSGITHVVNYDLPTEPDDYVHRVGRTARAGNDGFALSFVTRDDRRALRDIEMAVGCRIPLYEIGSK